MPIIVVNTNVPKDKIKSTIRKDLTSFLAEAMNVPGPCVLVHIKPDQWMSFGGTGEPCAACLVASISEFDAESNRKAAKSIMTYLYDALGVADDRMYLEFNCATKETVGLKADTFYGNGILDATLGK